MQAESIKVAPARARMDSELSSDEIDEIVIIMMMLGEYVLK